MIKKLKRPFDLFSPLFCAERVELLIFDDIYPHPISGFRLEEFTRLLKEFDNSKITLNPTAYKFIGTPIEKHALHVKEITKHNDHLTNKLVKTEAKQFKPKLFYCVFLTNILKNLDWLEENSIPFVFTLYPGGGFLVNDEKTDQKLKKILNSAMFRKVIVTQEFTKNYLLQKNFCDADKIELIFGCVVPQSSIKTDLPGKQYYKRDKQTFDICFCAAKYSKYGEDKGYDEFIKFAHSISNRFDFVRFHIIGGFNKEDIDVTEIEKNITFYGYLDFSELKSVYLNMDVIVSPNKPFVLSSGAFDGFPLGTVVEAVLNGVVALVSDCLNENSAFTDNEELIIIEPDSASIEFNIVKLIENTDMLFRISKNGRRKFSQIYSNDVQIAPRIEILQKELSKS